MWWFSYFIAITKNRQSSNHLFSTRQSNERFSNYSHKRWTWIIAFFGANKLYNFSSTMAKRTGPKSIYYCLPTFYRLWLLLNSHVCRLAFYPRPEYLIEKKKYKKKSFLSLERRLQIVADTTWLLIIRSKVAVEQK